MQIEDAPQVNEYYQERMSDMLNGVLEIPAVRHSARRAFDRIHASDTDLCPLPAFYDRTVETLPTFHPIATLQMFRGRLIEHALTEELPPVCKNYGGKIDIWMTVDGVYPGDKRYIEIKSTLESSDIMQPLEDHPDWTKRIMAYCWGHGVNEMYLFVYFLAGNLMNYPWWMKSKLVALYGEGWRKKCSYATATTKAWLMKFTDSELGRNIKEVADRAVRLRNALDSDNVEHWLPPDYVATQRPAWQCKRCRYNVNYCYFMQKYKESDAKGKSTGKVRRRKS